MLPIVRVASVALLGLLLAAGCGRGDLGEPCSEDESCSRGLKCWDANIFLVNASPDLGQCSMPCEADADCPDEGTCVGGLCARACSGAGDPACGEGTTCAGQWCVLTCSDSSECGALAVCPVAGGICEADPEV